MALHAQAGGDETFDSHDVGVSMAFMRDMHGKGHHDSKDGYCRQSISLMRRGDEYVPKPTLQIFADDLGSP